jgi:hypothetical protein
VTEEIDRNDHALGKPGRPMASQGSQNGPSAWRSFLKVYLWIGLLLWQLLVLSYSIGLTRAAWSAPTWADTFWALTALPIPLLMLEIVNIVRVVLWGPSLVLWCISGPSSQTFWMWLLPGLWTEAL